MAITEEQYRAALELQKRNTLSPEQSAAAAEIVRRYTMTGMNIPAEQDVRRSVIVGQEQQASQIPYQPSGIGATAGSLGGSLSTEMAGARAGRTLGTVLGGAITRTPQGAQLGGNLGQFGGAFIASALGAGGGGFAGDLAERMAAGVYRDDNTLNDAFSQAVQAGEQEAAYDLIGGLLFKGGGAVLKRVLGSPLKAGAPEAQSIMAMYGTGLALDQAVDRALLNEVSAALRGGLITGGSFEALNAAQNKAAVDFYDDFIEAYAGATRESLTEEGAGKLILNVLKGGETVFDNAVSDMFSLLDRQAVLRSSRPTTVDVEISPAISGVKERTTRSVAAQAFEKPVDVSSIRQRARNIVGDIKEIGDIDPTAEGTSLLRNIASGDSRLTFAQTHTLISDLKRLQRSGRLSGLPAETRVGDFIGELQKSFDLAGKQLPEDLAQQYAKMRSFTRFGKQKFESEFIAKLMDKEALDAQAVSSMVANASPGDVIRLRQTMRLADRFRGVEAGTSWKTVQGVVLDEILPRNIEEIGKTPIFNIRTDRALQSRLNKIFSQPELETIYRNVELLNKVVFDRAGSGALSGRQAGAAVRGLYGLGGAALGMGSYEAGGTQGAAASVGTYLLAPKLLSKLIASPKLTASLAAWNSALQIKGPSRANAIVKAVRLLEQTAQEVSEQAPPAE